MHFDIHQQDYCNVFNIYSNSLPILGSMDIGLKLPKSLEFKQGIL